MTTPIVDLRVDHRPNGIGVGARPRLSWRLQGAIPGVEQRGYQVQQHGAAGKRVVGVHGVGQVLVPWPFEPLSSRERCRVRVRVEFADGSQTDWSEPLELEAGLLMVTDWTVPFVSPSLTAEHTLPRPAYVLRSTFELAETPDAARLYLSAHGVVVATINGLPVGDHELVPGWTSYQHRLRYEIHDVVGLLECGTNVIVAELADGWFRGRLGFNGGLWDIYGEHVAILAQLETTSGDHTTVVPITDSWRSSTGAVVSASLYDGEVFDARQASGYASPNTEHRDWQVPGLIAVDAMSAELTSATGDPVRVTERLAARSIEARPNGRIRLDFGQNIAGRLEIRVRGPRGHRVRLHHAEVLENDELAVRPLRRAPSIDEYVLRGDSGGETWSPAFTVHGFRFAEIENWPPEAGEVDCTALVMHCDFERVGWFESSHALLDQLHENTRWSMRGNFVHLPTDCPQRDERLGWTGDIQVFAPAATFLYDCAGVLEDWLSDLSSEQGENGHVPNFVPWIACGFPEPASAAWGDAAVVVPWVLYERTGDTGILARQYDSMIKWVDHLARKRNGDLIVEGFQLGDWLDPAAPPHDPGAGRTDRYLVANAYLTRSARITADTAALLGNQPDAERFAELSDGTASAFRERYLDENGTMIDPSATGLSLAIMFDLLNTSEQIRAAGQLLAEIVAAGGHLIQTGFVGTPLICDALARTGMIDDAYRLLLQEACPSWLYPVTMGATTVWERWDSMLPDGSVNPGQMTSFNHYALGAVVDFMHRVVAGIAPAAPGYRSIRLAPQPGRVLEHASARHVTPYGLAEVHWARDGATFNLDVLVPTGSTGEVILPDAVGTVHFVGSGHHQFRCELAG